jgi:MoxR-like ATPase
MQYAKIIKKPEIKQDTIVDDFSFDKDLIYKFLFNSYEKAKKDNKIENEFNNYNYSHLFKIICNSFYKNPISRIKNNINLVINEIPFEKSANFYFFCNNNEEKLNIFYKYCASLQNILDVGDSCVFMVGFKKQKYLETFSLENIGLKSYKKASNISSIIYNDKDYQKYFDQFNLDESTDIRFFLNFQKLFNDYITILNYFSFFIKDYQIDLKKINHYKNNLPVIINAKEKKHQLNKINDIGKKETDETYDQYKFLSDLERAVILSTFDPNKISNNIKKKVIGQDKAIDDVINALLLMSVGSRDQNVPLNFYAAGPTGVGKNYLFEILAQELSLLYNTNVFYKEINCSSLQGQGAINQLIGSNKGYISSDKDSILFNFYKEAKLSPFSILLFDEFEKSHYSLIDFLLPILDKGGLYDNKENFIDLSGTFIAFTSNIGYSDLRGNKNKQMGFSSDYKNSEIKARKEYIINQINTRFTPEFLNRINIVHFNYLNEESISKIFDLEFEKISKRLENRFDIKIECDKKLKKELIQMGFSKEYGARQIKSLLNKDITIPLAKELNKDNMVDLDKSKELLLYIKDLKKKITNSENNYFSRDNVLNHINELLQKKLPYDELLIKKTTNDGLKIIKK